MQPHVRGSLDLSLTHLEGGPDHFLGPSSTISDLRAGILVMFRESGDRAHLTVQPSLFTHEETATCIGEVV